MTSKNVTLGLVYGEQNKIGRYTNGSHNSAIYGLQRLWVKAAEYNLIT